MRPNLFTLTDAQKRYNMAMELYRYALVLVVALTAWVGMQNFIVAIWKKTLGVHLWFASLVSLVCIHDFLWLIRSFIADPIISHRINMVQWGLVWLIMATMAPFIESYLHGKRGRLSKFVWAISAFFFLCIVLLHNGGFYSQMPVVTSVQLPWGESFFSPDYQKSMTSLYAASVLLVAICFALFFVRALFFETKDSSFLSGRYLTTGLGIILLCLVYDTILDMHWFAFPPILLQHIGVIIMIVGMNFSFSKEIHLAVHIRDQLVSSEMQLSLMMLNIPAVIYRLHFDETGKAFVDSMSGNVESVLGATTSKETFLGVLKNGLSFDDNERLQHLSDFVRIAKQPLEFEALFNHPDGQPRWIRLSSMPSEDGKVFYFTGILLDQTPQWKSELERKKLTEDLQRKTDEQESVLYATSHDLRSPLLNMSGFANEIRTELIEIKRLLSLPEPPAPSVLSQHVTALNEGMQFIDSSVARMSMLLDGLLAVNRSGRLPIEIQKVAVSSLVQKLTESMQHQIRQHGAHILFDDLEPCFADPNLLVQIFANLLDNALKYRHPQRKPVIKIMSELKSGVVHYHIIDNGLGFKQELAPLLFRLFHRLNPRGDVPGQGVGLTIVQRLVHRMNGGIEVSSVEDEGSTFTITLPAIPSFPT